MGLNRRGKGGAASLLRRQAGIAAMAISATSDLASALAVASALVHDDSFALEHDDLGEDAVARFELARPWTRSSHRCRP